jgi:small subunit ribosomal protein S20
VADHPSALKRHRQSEKRRLRNAAIRNRLRNLVRAVRSAISAKDRTAATEGLAQATRALDKAVTKGVLHRNSAARKAGRLAKAVHQITRESAG